MDQEPIRELLRENRFLKGTLIMFVSPFLVILATLFALPPPELRLTRDWPMGALLFSRAATFGGALLALLNLGTSASTCKRFICSAAVAMTLTVGLSSTVAAEQCYARPASFECAAGMFPLVALIVISAVASAITSSELRAAVAWEVAAGSKESDPLRGPNPCQ